MVLWLILVLHVAVTSLKSRRNWLLENLALRHQVLVLSRTRKRPRLMPLDRALWAWLSKNWHAWKMHVLIVQPDTVIRWHRNGFRLFWKWRSRLRKPGRKTTDPETIALIRTMSHANPLWGAPRIHGELLKLGTTVAQRTVAKYMVHRAPRPPSQKWKTFLRNHLGSMVSVDFFTVPTLTFQVLYVFIVLSHHRRNVLHFNIVECPSANWTAQQLREAFPFASPPKYLLRDRDGIYGLAFRRRANALGMKEVRTAPRSPWQSPYVERLIGSIRRDCLDHVIVFNQGHRSAYSDPTSPTITGAGLTWLWTKMRRKLDESRGRKKEPLSPFQKWVACITDTSVVRPERTTPRSSPIRLRIQ